MYTNGEPVKPWRMLALDERYGADVGAYWMTLRRSLGHQSRDHTKYFDLRLLLSQWMMQTWYRNKHKWLELNDV